MKSFQNKRLIVSNTTWGNLPDNNAVSLLKQYGINMIQLSFQKYIDPTDADQELVLELLDQFNHLDIEIWSIESIFQNVDLNIFDDREKFANHFIRMIDLAIIVNASVLVYNCPKSRKLPDDINIHTANYIFSDTISYLCQYIRNKNSNLIIALEPCDNEKLSYRNNYITCYREAVRIIDHVDSENFKLCFNTETFAKDPDFSRKYFDIIKNKIAHTHVVIPSYEISPVSGSLCMKVSDKQRFKDDLLNFIRVTSSNY